MMFTNGLKNTLNSIISTQNYEKYPTTNSYLGWARIFKIGRLPNFSCGVMDSGNDADPMHYAQINVGLSSVSKSEKNPEVTGGNLPMWTKL